MRFFPLLTEEYSSPLSPDALLSRVRANTSDWPFWSWKGFLGKTVITLFRGSVAPDGFLIRREIEYGTEFWTDHLLQLRGSIVSDYGERGSRLRLRYRHKLLWLIGHGFFIGMLALLTALAGWQVVSTTESVVLLLIPSGALVAYTLAFLMPFWKEVSQSRALLMRLLDLTLLPPA